MGQLKNRGIGLKDKLESGKTYYEIRLESIGGLGANLCGKMLGERGVKYLDVNSSNFSSYGSEKTGTPVKGFIRYCKKEKELREHSPVVEPDLLVVFHQALLKDVSIWKGCGEETAVIIALEPGQEQPEITGCNYDACYGLEAQKIAMETHSRINVVMLGAVLKIMGIENLSVGEQICKDTLGKKYPDALKANLEGMKRGYEEVRRLEKKAEQKQKDNQFQGKELHKANATEHKSLKQSDWGYANAPLGGVNPNFGSTVVADLSPSRQGYIPLFIQAGQLWAMLFCLS